jgi:hypothetical protein
LATRGIVQLFNGIGGLPASSTMKSIIDSLFTFNGTNGAEKRHDTRNCEIRLFPKKKRRSLFTLEISLPYNIFVGGSGFVNAAPTDCRFRARTN